MSKCNIKVCKSACCYNVPHTKQYFTSLKNRIVNPIIRLEAIDKTHAMAITDEEPDKNKCPFLRKDYKCNIYDRRPSICRMFGEGKHKYLQCGHLGQKMPTVDEILKDLDFAQNVLKLRGKI